METSLSSGIEGGQDPKVDDDGHPKRTGTLITTTAHIITAVIGSGVLSLAWATAQLGWIAGPATLLAFALISCYAASLLADCYRSPDGKRNQTYMEVVRAHLGGHNVKICGIAQFSNLIGTTIGYTITTSLSLMAIEKSNCYHKNGHDANCRQKNMSFTILYGMAQVFLSQIPNFHELAFLSIFAALMSFTYSSIALGLSIDRIARRGCAKTSLTGRPIGPNFSTTEKMWNIFAALGDIGFAYIFSNVLVEIQDTVKASPRENKVMKQATLCGICISSIFYMLCGVLGYAAFGNDAPSNILTTFGFYDPFWLIDFANACIVVHLLGAYQVFAQPVFAFVEKRCENRWPDSRFINGKSFKISANKTWNVSMFKLTWRTAYVALTTIVAMLFPFFNDFVGLLGAISYWPLTIYLPFQMYIKRTNIRRLSFTWIWLTVLCVACLLLSILAAAGSIRGLIKAVRRFEPFQAES
ncbi:amino acid permease 6-like [Ipomoea triloba]|uniref:amino acid permease 6-like n=1 Tax=Ipomoea triloba TaxID=35885 RepID=UPI00125DCC6A|nr:amino acid permease 6-like [Ipomoea triloba]